MTAEKIKQQGLSITEGIRPYFNKLMVDNHDRSSSTRKEQ